MLTAAQMAMIRKKEASLPEGHKRDPLTNYFEGYFFVTLNVRDEAPILGTVEGRVGVPYGEADAPHVRYTELGQKVLEVWKGIPQYSPNVTVLDAEAMPDHFHGLLYMKKVEKVHLGRVVNGFMIGCTHAYWDTIGIAWREMKNEEGTGAKARVWQDRYHTRSYRGPALFVRGYNDVVPITQEEVQIKIEYIHSQAERRLIKRDFHDRFHVFRHQHSRNWTVDVAMRAVAADPFFAKNPDKRELAQKNVLSRLYPDALLDYIGNRQWMMNERKLPLICHRADANHFDEQASAVISAARDGNVIVSAFISAREREIKQLLMTEQLPFIEIMDNGFSTKYKPVGKAFYACGENRLVQITPWSCIYQKEVQVTREMCLVMNELARVISKNDDDWWKGS